MWQTLVKRVTALSPRGHQSGRERAVWESLLEQTSQNNQMALCAVLRIAHSTHKNTDLNRMALCVSCMLLVLAIAVRVYCENSV